MHVWVTFHLDPNCYGQNDAVQDFDSLKEAKDTFWRFCDTERLGDEREHSAWVWFYDPRGVMDPYPDRIMRLGPRGGVRVEYA